MKHEGLSRFDHPQPSTWLPLPTNKDYETYFSLVFNNPIFAYSIEMKRLLWLMSSVNDPDARVAGAETLSTNQNPELEVTDQSEAGKLMTMDIVPFIRHDSQRQYLSSTATMGRTHLLQRQTIHRHNAETIWTLEAAHSWQILAFLLHLQIAIYAAISIWSAAPHFTGREYSNSFNYW